MSRLVALGDLHVDDGAPLGDPDVTWGSSRLADARQTLMAIAAAIGPADVVCLMGDVARGPAPRPAAIGVLQAFLAASPARRTVAVLGNHDHTLERVSVLDVLSEPLSGAMDVHRSPGIVDCGDVQVATLPWTPPQRLYGQLRDGARGAAHADVAERLLDVARGLGARIDPERPSVLLCHWLLSGSVLASGKDVLSAHEPVLPVEELEASGPWSAVLAGHNHVRQRLGERTWVVGPPLRHSFGEASLEVGYLTVDLQPGRAAEVAWVDVPDLRLLTLRPDPSELLEGTADWPDVADATVRVVVACDEDQARRLQADGGRLLTAVSDELVLAGARKVIGPQLDVHRDQHARSELEVDTDPLVALAAWLDARDIDPAVREEAEAIAAAIIAGGSDDNADELAAEVGETLLATTVVREDPSLHWEDHLEAAAADWEL